MAQEVQQGIAALAGANAVIEGALNGEDPKRLNELLALLSTRLLPPGLVFRFVDLTTLKEQDLNPRTMPVKMFEQLVANIGNTGGLESLPLCVDMLDGSTAIVSGHHRTRAAIRAGVKKHIVLVYTNLSRSAIIAKQLSHNTIAGSDDLQIMKKLWEEIDDVSSKFESFVDPRAFESLPETVQFSQVDIDLQEACKSVVLTFIPVQLRNVEKLIELAVPDVQADRIYLAHREIFDEWTGALRKLRTDAEVVSVPTAVSEMARLSLLALDAGLHDKGAMKSLADLFGGAHMPPDAAAVVVQAIDKMIATGDCDPEHKWQAIERWAADYLAGA